MARPLYDSEYLFGIHEPGGEPEMLAAGRPGWIVFTEGLGHNPNDKTGRDYRAYSDRGLGVITRLNNGYYPEGTIPYRQYYADFAQRCANFVAASRGCKIWIIGNEMNYAIERPQSGRSMFAPEGRPAADASGADAPDDVTPAPPKAPAGLWRTFTRLFGALLGRPDSGDDEPVPPPLPPASKDTPYPAPPPHRTAPPDDPFFRSDPSRFSALHDTATPAPPADVASDAPDVALPGAAARGSVGEVITPELYAECYRLCRDAIHSVPGHEDDQVLIGAVAPWNNQTRYPGNPNGDWVQYMADILVLLGPDGCDGITLHTYTHQADPNLIRSDAKMNPPFEHRHYEFRAYQDFMHAIPITMRHLPVYITETDQDVAWLDRNIAWVQQAYGEIDWWNQQPGSQQIRALILYRWPRIDKWYIEGKDGVIEDFRQALQHDYKWSIPLPEPADFAQGDTLETLDVVNMRRTPGYLSKESGDVVAEIPAATRLTVLSSDYAVANGLTWWRARVADNPEGEGGWLAQTSPTGIALLRKVEGEPDVDSGDSSEIAVGARVRVREVTRLRRTPGYQNKPESDIVTELPVGTVASVSAGPENRDGLVWWRLWISDPNKRVLEGWAAESAPNGVRLLEPDETPAPPSQGANGGTPSQKFSRGDSVVTMDYVNLRRTPGYEAKPEDDILAELPPSTRGTVQGGPAAADGLTWWLLATVSVDGQAVDGWAAETAPTGLILLDAVPPRPPLPDGAFVPGELIQTTTWVRLRRSPGIEGKPDDDVLGDFLPATTLNILGGPQAVDGLTWWNVVGILPAAGELYGWSAQSAPTGMTLLQRAPDLPGTSMPSKHFLGAPFRGRYGISQLWGENPDVYQQFSYDGVPLLGHNGVDFLTPTGVELLAVDDGVVSEAVYNDPSGFGHYVKVLHGWGESVYAHMQGLNVVAGEPVRRGQLLGFSDDTGFSGGPHLHFALRINPFARTDGWGGFADPLPYLNPADYFLPPYFLPPAAGAPAPEGIDPQRWGTGPGLAPDQPGVRRP